MAKKKKKATKQRKGTKNEADLEEARDEMLALSAIFAEAMVVDEDQAGFNLRVVPHPGEAEANHVAVQLTVSYPRNYPHEELGLKLVEPQGLADADVKALSKQLHQTAAQYAAEGEICCFQLVNMCQEFLQERNFPPDEDSDSPPAPESLWHEMQQRETNAELATASAADVDFSFRASGYLGGDNWGFDDIGGSLFAEPADPVWSAAAVPSSPPPASVMGPGLLPKPKTPKSPKAAARQLAGEATGHTFAHTKGQLPEGRTVTVARPVPTEAAAAAATAGAGPSPEVREGAVAGAAGGAQVLKGTAAGPVALPTETGPAAAAEPAAQPGQPLNARPAEQLEPPSRDVSAAGQRSPFESASVATSEAGTSKSGAVEASAIAAATNAPSVSRVNTMLTAMKQSISAVSKAILPKLLRRQLEGQHSESASEDGDSTVGVPENDAEREQIRRELLMGHLLTLAASGGNAAVPPHALPAVAAMLQSQGLLPKWVGWTLTQQPALFDRAFQRLFSQEMQRRSSSGGGSSDQQDPSVSWAIDRFWQRRPLLASRSINTLRSKPLGMLNIDGQQPASRYETDFAEIRQLGRGGYGVVMAAVNRMDGRQYAIKKILLDAHSPHAYARIMREVTTLSRLQHPNVVRYYQAWVETTTAAAAGHVGDSESEGSEWGGSSSLTPSLQPSSPAAAAAAVAALRRHSPSGGTAAAAGTAGMGVPPGRGAGLRGGPASAPAAAAGRGVPPGGLYPVTENSREGRASSPSNWDTSRGGDASTVTTSSAEGGGGAWGGGLGNLAVADGARLLSSAHGSASRLTVLSGDSSGGPPWQSAYGSSGSDEDSDSVGTASSSTSSGGASGSGSSASGSSSGAGSESRSPDRGRNGGDETAQFDIPASMPMSRGASGDTSNSAFTFERPASGTGGSGERGQGGARAAGLAGGGSSSQPSLLPKGRSPRQRSVLFIQMEFCPRTLRDVLDAGPLEDADRWRVLRQILAGLAHIHSQGIIHRDLKPANIFYDSKGDIKLGDFGLAKFNVQGADGELPVAPAAPGAVPGAAGAGVGRAVAGHASGTLRAGPSTLASEATGVCGTSMYISPEIANGWASYDEKVDLYSLGVVAFELWHPFSTGMERVVLLRDLRENDVMPADFEAANPVVCQVIRWLMAPNPAQRPTAKEVLRSDLLPATVGDEQLRDLLRSLPDNPATYDKVVDAVFNLSRGSEAPAAEEAAGAPAPVQMAARDHIVDCVKEVFCRHGAVPMFSLDVGFATAEDPKGAMQVVSPSGVKLALRYEMRQPFASWLVHQVAKGGSGSMLVEGFRRYELAWVQRRVSGQAGLPRSYLQADLDFVLPLARTSAEQLLGEAEVMSAVHDVLLELPECGQLEVRIGHRHLFELALQYVGVSRELRGSVAQLLSTASAASPLHAQARSKRWPSIRAGLEGLGLGQEAIGRCRQLVLQGAGEAEVALFRLRAYLSQSAGASRRHSGSHPLACLDDIQSLLPHLAAWGLPTCQLVVDPLVPPHADYFTGILFQFHALQEANGATAVVAVGGRYDGLLKVAWARQAGLAGISGPMPPMGAVGATLNVERLVALAAATARWRRPVGGPAGLAKLSQADVLVCSRGGGGLLRERMQLVRSLWDAGVAAEMLHAAAPSLTDQYEYANSRGIPWLVIIQGATFSAADTVRVKHLERRLEEDVPVADLVRYLQAALAPHGASAGAYTSGPGMTNRGSVVREGEGEHGDGGEELSTHGGGRAERERERRRGRERRDR